MPGALVPGDLERIQDYVGDASPDFVLEHFCASDGAKILRCIEGKFYKVAVPSIVPAQRPDGRCVFLTDDDRCSIHPVSPFGCSQLDYHMSNAEADRRVQQMVYSQVEDHQKNGTFSKFTRLLLELGLVAKPLVERRAAMRQLTEEVERTCTLPTKNQST